MLKKLSISSSSFVLPNHPAWNSLAKKFSLDFKYVGNFSQSLLSKNVNDIIVCILFISDLYDENLGSNKSESGINEINNSIINLIKKKAEITKVPMIFAVSGLASFNIISSVFEKPLAEKIYEDFLNKLFLLQKKYSNIYILNLDYSFSNFGAYKIFDKRNWYLANCRVSTSGLEVIVKDINKVLNRIYHPARKLLVLDCDNTLWGGVIGEEGIKSIKLGEDGLGKAFMDFQKTIKHLSNNGTLLAVCSKNNEVDVLDVFENHKSMQIKKKDITSFKVNWDEKFINIKKISEELNLSLDSFAYWDDNPFERDKVKKSLPEVLTITPADEVVNWPDQLRALEDFAKFNFTDEDKKKAYQYKIRSKFISAKSKVIDEDSYLKSIKLKAKKIKINSSTISRAVQMTQKTNQFNLRTARYTQKDIEKLQKNKKNIIFLVNLEDVYGDHGIVGLIIGKHLNKESIFLDTFLISCRVLGRNLESWMLRELKRSAKKFKYLDIYAEYIKTKKNVIAKEVLTKHSFKKISKNKKEKVLSNIKLQDELYYSKIKNIDNFKATVYD